MKRKSDQERVGVSVEESKVRRKEITPQLGLEWQFSAGMSLYPSWALREKVPSKGVVFCWKPDVQTPGVIIESDSGDFEFITEPVKNWQQLKKQLIVIGEILTLCDGKSPLTTENSIAETLLKEELNSQFPMKGTSRRRTLNLPTDTANFTLEDGHIKLAGQRDQVLFIRQAPPNTNGKWTVKLATVPETIYEVQFQIVKNAEQPRQIFLNHTQPGTNRIIIQSA